MARKTNTLNPIERFQGMVIPDSNEPYGVGHDPANAARRQEGRDEFLGNDEIAWPDLEYPLLDDQQMHRIEHELLALLNAVIADEEMTENTKEIVYEQIAIKLAETYRHLEVIRGLGSVASRKEISRERAGLMTREIFGEPEIDTFNRLRDQDAILAYKVAKSSDPTLAAIARDFISLAHLAEPASVEVNDESVENTGEVKSREKETSFELKESTMEIIRGDLMTLFPGLQDFIDEASSESVNVEDMVSRFTKVLEIFGLDKKGWSTVLIEGNAASANSKVKQIQLGKYRKPFTPKGATTVPIHEAGHALRSQNASEQTDPARRQALPGSLPFEEGLMTALEQIINLESRMSGVPYYLSLGYQLGLDEGAPARRNFRQTHEIMWRRALLTSAKAGKEVKTTDVLKAKQPAYQTVIRTTRGNSFDARDISYLEGAIKANQWCNEIALLPEEERLRELRRAFSGKFDPTNPVDDELFDDTIQTN